MTLRELLNDAARLFSVRECGMGYICTADSTVHPTRAAAYKAAARSRVYWTAGMWLLANKKPVDAADIWSLVARHTANGGDWRDCARAALRELEGRTVRSDRRP